MRELSLNVMDIAQNSISAGAEQIEISVLENPKADSMTITVSDNGCGMTPEQTANVTDPFLPRVLHAVWGLACPFLKWKLK